MSGKTAKAKRRRERLQATVAPVDTPRSDLRGAPLLDLVRADLAWAAATALASALLFATVLTSYPALGDAPESVAGVSSVGILHAPGYPAYVLAAKAFTLLIPFGTEALAVNLFSLVCAALAVGVTQLLARRCGAERWAATLGALSLAVGAGYWFSAGFAKHNVFSGLLFVLALYLLLAWIARPTAGRLVGAGALFALGLGSSWPLAVLLAPAIAFVLVIFRDRLGWRASGAALAASIVTVCALYGFVMVRAATDPPLNWGRATSLGRVQELVNRSDFKADAAPPSPPKATAATARAATTELAGIAPSQATRGYLGIFARELGLAGLVLAAWGLVVSLRGRRRSAAIPLVLVFGANMLAVLSQLGTGARTTASTNLITAGFLLGCYFVLACWLALGATDLLSRVRALLARGRAGARRQVLEAAAVVVLAGVVLVPPAVAAWPVAHRGGTPLADRYASAVFASLPRNAIVFIGSAELSQPLVYHQVVLGERPDVAVIAADGLVYPWYREVAAQELGRPLPPRVGSTRGDAEQTARSLLGVRPLYADPVAAQLVKGAVGFRPAGVVYALTRGKGAQPVRSAQALERTVRAQQRAAGFPDARLRVFPNVLLAQATYAPAALEVARAYAEANDIPGVERALRNVLAIDPENRLARQNLEIAKLRARLQGPRPPAGQGPVAP